jgi:hypothetical protein
VARPSKLTPELRERIERELADAAPIVVRICSLQFVRYVLVSRNGAVPVLSSGAPSFLVVIPGMTPGIAIPLNDFPADLRRIPREALACGSWSRPPQVEGDRARRLAVLR